MGLSDADRFNINRRRLLALAGTAATAPFVPATAQAAHSDLAPLARDISVAALQTRATPGATRLNLASMLAAVDRVHDIAGPKHLVTFADQALQGRVHGDAADLAAVAIDLDGPEFAAIAAKARENQIHIAFAAWVRDADWTGKVISMSILIGPDGRLLAKDWAAFQGDASRPDVGRFASTIQTEFDQYVERYGRDAMLPLHETSIGRIALSSAVESPEIFRAFGHKGVEIVIRTAPSGAPSWDLQATSGHNRCYAVMTTLADDPEVALAPGRGGTAIVGPRGEILAEAGSRWEQAVTATLTVAHLRATRRPLEIPAAAAASTYRPVTRGLA